MEEIKIIARFSELTTKGKNRSIFIKKLRQNFLFKIKNSNLMESTSLKSNYDYFEISLNDNSKLDLLMSNLNTLTGISKYSIIKEFYSKDHLIKELIEKYKDTELTFKIIPKKRKNNIISSSDEFKRNIAELLLKNTKLRVDIINPQIEIILEIVDDRILWHIQTYKCDDGLPSGINGRGLLMLSGGIDSPVAAYKLMNRGLHLDFITFLTPPLTSKDVEKKINEIAIRLSKYNGSKTTWYVVNCTEVMKEIRDIKEAERYRITLFRRFFARFSNVIANKNNYEFFATGDSLGQVASQTLDSLLCVDSASEKMIIRPLIGLSKNEIIEVSRKIGTYELSLIDEEDMCINFSPKNPIINPKLEKIIILESKLNDNIINANDFQINNVKELSIK